MFSQYRYGRVLALAISCFVLLALAQEVQADEAEFNVRPKENKSIGYRFKSLTSMDIQMAVKTGDAPPVIEKLKDGKQSIFNQKFYSLVDAAYESKSINVSTKDASFTSMITKLSLLTKMVHGGEVSRGKIEADKKTTWIYPPRFYYSPIDEVGEKRIFSFVGKEIGYMVNRQGKLRDFSVPAKLTEVSKVWTSSKPGIAPEFPITFPKGKTKEGDTWRIEREIPFMKDAKGNPLKRSYLICKFEGIKEFSGVPSFKVSVSGSFKASSDGDKNQQLHLLNPKGASYVGTISVQVNAVYYYDIETCLLLGGECKYNQTLDMWMARPGSAKVNTMPKANLLSIVSKQKIITTRRTAIARRKLIKKKDAFFNFSIPDKEIEKPEKKDDSEPKPADEEEDLDSE